MLNVIWVVLIVAPLAAQVILDYQAKRSRKKFNQDVERLMFIAIHACDCTGSIAMPKYNGPRAWNAETGKEELIFTELSDDGRARTIYVSRDGKDVRAMPWRED